LSEWVTGEVITAAKLNQKELFIGDTAPVSPTDGQLWYDTVNKLLKQYIAAEAAWRTVGGDIPVDQVVVPTPTAADYVTPKAVSDSSATEALWLENTASNYTLGLFNGYYVRAGHQITVPAKTISKVCLYLRKYGSPTGTAYCRIRRVSDDSIISEVSFDVATLTTSYTWREFALPTPVFINEEVRFLAEFYGGNSSNRLEISYSYNYIDGFFARYKTAWETTGYDTTIKIYEAYSGVNTIDDNLDTFWQPSPANEPGAWLQWDLAGKKLLSISGLRIYWGADAAYRPTNYDIDYSEDGTTWIQLINETVDPGAGWKEYTWTPVDFVRYLRLQINTHGTSGTRVYETDYYQTSIWRHGHYV